MKPAEDHEDTQTWGWAGWFKELDRMHKSFNYSTPDKGEGKQVVGFTLLSRAGESDLDVKCTVHRFMILKIGTWIQKQTHFIWYFTTSIYKIQNFYEKLYNFFF